MDYHYLKEKQMNEYLLDFSKLGKELGTINKNLPERFDLSDPLTPILGILLYKKYFGYLERFIAILKEQILAIYYNSNSYYNK